MTAAANHLDLLDRVDFRTGELFESIAYVVTPSRLPLTAAPTLAAGATPTSASQMARLLVSKDGRTLKRINDVRRIYDADKGDHHYSGKAVSMTNAEYELINRLVQAIDYRNIIITPILEMAELLGVGRSHVHRKLAYLKGVVRVSGSTGGIRKGDIKVEINPAYGFRYERDALPTARASAMNHWISTFIRER